MSVLATHLEDFGSSFYPMSRVSHSEETLENERLEAFDKGYRAGWDDAIKAKSDDSDQLSDTLAQNLQDLSFTYHEAHAQVLSNLAPLFDEILQKMLPAIAKDTLGEHISEQLTRAAKEMGTVTVEVIVAPGAGEEVSQCINGAVSSLPVSVKESGSVGVGQAELRLGGKEIAIDLTSVTSQITQAVRAAMHHDKAASLHG
jgi:flagellar assembly protein FliH